MIISTFIAVQAVVCLLAMASPAMGAPLTACSMLSIRNNKHSCQQMRRNELVTAKMVDSEIDVVAEDNKPTLYQTLAPVLCAAFTAAAVLYPLDLIRALKMANAANQKPSGVLLQNFVKIHGLQGFFTQGLAPELGRSTWIRLIKFGLFPFVHRAVSGVSEAQGSAGTRVVAAILTSVPEAISIMPLEISKIVLQLDKTNAYRNNMFRAMSAVHKKTGLMGLYTTGYWGVQYRQAAWSAAYFASISSFKKLTDYAIEMIGEGYFEAAHPDRSAAVSTAMSGFLAGVFGAAINTPGDTVRSTIQKRLLGATVGKTTTLIGVGKEIYLTKGVLGLYSGFTYKALHLGGAGALMALLIPFYRKLLVPPKESEADSATN